MNQWIGIFLLFGGLFFIIVTAVGVVRLPDFYTRLHATGKSETLGILLSFLGLAFYHGISLTSFKMLLIILFILFANPIGTHLLSRAAYRAGVKHWEKGGQP